MINNIYNRNKNKFLSVILGIFLLISIIFYSTVIKDSCKDWNKGIYKDLENKKGTCQIKGPTICWNEILDGIFNMKRIYNIKSCELEPVLN